MSHHPAPGNTPGSSPESVPEITPQNSSGTSAEARGFPRLKVPAMYSLVRVRPAGGDRYLWTGHIYDVSLSGMRFEIDHALEPGTPVEVRGILPGQEHVTFSATGTVVRFHDDSPEPGPTRMGMNFASDHHEADQDRLTDYLDDHGLKIAA
ncbi:MAG: PilZ domain-containing protein [Planctomycetota bacterium]